MLIFRITNSKFLILQEEELVVEALKANIVSKLISTDLIYFLDIILEIFRVIISTEKEHGFE